MKILIAEDDQTMRQMMLTFWSGVGSYALRLMTASRRSRRINLIATLFPA